MSILRRLGLVPREPDPSTDRHDTDTLRKITHALEEMEPERARYLAAFAFILARVANADLSISEEETAEMERIVARWGNLPEAQAVLVVQIAKSQNKLFGATDNYLATREFREVSDRAEKHALLHCLFAVSAADDEITPTEEQVIRQISDELGLSHEEYVSIRAAYREKRSIFKNA